MLQRLLALELHRSVEVDAVDRRLVAEVRAGGEDHLAGARVGEAEERRREAGSGPDLLHLGGPRIELVEVDDVKAARASCALGHEVGEVLVERAPARGALAVGDAAELEGAQEADARIAIDEEGGIGHVVQVAPAAGRSDARPEPRAPLSDAPARPRPDPTQATNGDRRWTAEGRG